MDDFYKSLLPSLASLIAGILITLITSKVAKIVLDKITKRTKTETDDYIAKVIVGIVKPLGIILSVSLAWMILPIAPGTNNFVMGVSKLIVLLIIIRASNKILIRLINRWSIHINDTAVSTMIDSLSPMIRSLVWAVGFVFYLQNMGVQMAAIWALLSAGGIGAGLALKEPVQEFFEYITILLDKPFQRGEFIHVEDVWATVEQVGVRSTRLKSINGEIIVMSNSSLTKGVISNYSEMKNRRIVHKLGVVYETDLSKMKDIPNTIESIVNTTTDAIFDRCNFVEFNSSSLDFELVYFVPTNDYIRAMKAQESINLNIMKTFKEKGIDFAYPTQTLHLKRLNP